MRVQKSNGSGFVVELAVGFAVDPPGVDHGAVVSLFDVQKHVLVVMVGSVEEILAVLEVVFKIRGTIRGIHLSMEVVKQPQPLKTVPGVAIGSGGAWRALEIL
jgi:hypothetical protein